jgi:hypothetical protein
VAKPYPAYQYFSHAQLVYNKKDNAQHPHYVLRGGGPGVGALSWGFPLAGNNEEIGMRGGGVRPAWQKGLGAPGATKGS